MSDNLSSFAQNNETRRSVSENFIESAIGSVSDETPETVEETESVSEGSEVVEIDEIGGDEGSVETESVEVAEEVTTTDTLMTEEIVSETTEGVAEETTETVAEEVTPDWTYALSVIPQGGTFELTEFGEQTYHYQRVNDPSGEMTNKFLVFCKDSNVTDDAGNEIWNPLGGVLTNRYTAASVEKFVAAIYEQMTILDEPQFLHVPFQSVWIGETESNISYFSDEAAKMVFSFVSGVDVQSIDNLSSMIKVVVSNSYDGSRSLRLDYAVKTTGLVTPAAEGAVAVESKLTDYLSLCNISHTVIHSGELTNVSGDLVNIQGQVDSNVGILKEYDTNLDQIANNITKCFRKEGREKFAGLYENLTGDYKKLFYVLLVTSLVIDSNYDINEHFKVRSLVDKLFKNIFRSNA